MERGEIPNDDALVGSLIEDVCYRNVERFTGLDVRTPAAT